MIVCGFFVRKIIYQRLHHDIEGRGTSFEALLAAVVVLYSYSDCAKKLEAIRRYRQMYTCSY